ncbi:acetyl-CoA carboxylase biotin carboxylase subunit family protein [Desulfosarcina sp.]|uniref:ATP-grasp domain-containing protein n=1 Tax=Desulfosarcina sp. TaxID=2027861 RepID=UPI0039704E07
MNLVYLSPNFPHHYHQFCKNLKLLGVNVLGVGDAPFDELDPMVKDALTEYYRLTDMHDYDQLVRACGYYTHRYGKIDRCESLNEYWLATEARIRDDFNITGIRGRGIDFIKRKSMMKGRFQSAGIPVAVGRVVSTVDEARGLVKITGYPVVAKPDAGVGALDTFRLDNAADLEAFFCAKPAEDYIMEEFIVGRIVSFDGLADADGNLVFFTAHRFSQGIMETVNQARHIHYTSLRDIPPALEKAGRRCVQAFDVRERFFHIEFFETAPGKYVALEVNMRPPGGFTTDMFNFACDIDVYHLWAQVMVNGRTELDYRRRYHCCYASRKNRYDYRNSHDQVMEKYRPFMVQAASVPGVFSSALGDFGYIFRSPDMEQIDEIVGYIQATK